MRSIDFLRIGIMAFSLLLVPVGAAFAGNGEALAKKMNDRWNAAFNRGDAGALADLYAENAIVSPGNGETLRGREAIEKLFQGYFDNGVQDHSIRLIEARQTGDELYEVAEWQAHGTDENGERTTFGGILVIIFQRDDEGNWQSRYHVWNVRN